ncbi:MAG: ATP-binding protein, partial [Lautropia sp.]
ASRAADDLSPVSEAGLPDEVRPLVHELNLLLGRVRTAFEAQRNFVADAAHELRSPLAALSLQVQSLRRAGDDAGREIAATRLAAGIERASRLIEQLLMLARQEASVATGVKSDRVELLGIVRHEVAEMTQVARRRNIDLGVVEDSSQVEVEGHSDALAILLRNLLDNAVKYTPPGGTVDVGIVMAADRATLQVEDSGPGIAPDLRERALARFDRSGHAAAGAAGSGLGLAIAKAIADRHGAELKLGRSDRLGGLKVEVIFPADAGPGALRR